MFESFEEFLSLEESVKLTPAELDKPNSATGEKRINILKDLIMSGTPIELAIGGSITVVNVNDAIRDILEFPRLKKPIVLVDKSGKIMTSSDLAKSEAFGGGKGSGGGTVQTAIAESAQCVWLEAMLHLGVNADLEEFTDAVLKAAYKNVDVDSSIKEILSIDNDWIKSSYHSAKQIIKQGYVKKGMKLHRGSSLMRGIYAKKNEAVKNSGLPKFTDDKWNPGDIWAASPSFKLSDLPTDSLKSLNKKILELFVNKQLIAISLKKVKNSAKDVVLNAKLPPDVDDHRVTKIKLESDRGNYWSSKGGTVIFDHDSKIEFRPNSYMGMLKGEIIGKGARGGSVSWNYIIDVVAATMRIQIPSMLKVHQLAKKIAAKDEKSIKEFYKYYTEFYKDMSYPAFKKAVAAKDVGWIDAKLGVTILLAAFHTKTGTVSNRAITKIINYAGSKSEDASTYVKISN